MSTSLVSKITIKSIKAQPKKHSVEQDTLLATLYGRCQDKKAGSSDFGEFIRFKGEFEAVNAESGDVFKSNEMIVPRILEGLLDNAITADENASVDFAMEIWAEANEASITGYSYTVKPLTEPQESDALQELRQLAQKSLPSA